MTYARMVFLLIAGIINAIPVVGDFGQPINKIIVADIIGSVALLAVLLMRSPSAQTTP